MKAFTITLGVQLLDSSSSSDESVSDADDAAVALITSKKRYAN